MTFSSKNNFLSDSDWMCHAFSLAEKAHSQGEVPIGAILVLESTVIGRGWNQSVDQHDPTAHAEIMALREGAQTCQNHRLINTTLYVTLEPCIMCVGALLHARIKRLVFGARDSKFGAIASKRFLLDSPEFNHRIDWEGGCLSDACSRLLKNFFSHRRS